ncbi:translationally-controlled tumor protein homolog [Hydra vulgaris]|uniref:translationally-controlled tumor protein homolog n=1 Tax=Hydra vulgaris TaxID=6087 RepID=UPI0001924691|nr:translationally-controlled tumor protein homolog [Hydra vulgaris]
MHVFKDVFTHEDVFSDAFTYDTDDTDLFYIVQGKIISEHEGIDDKLISANKSFLKKGEKLHDKDLLFPDIIRANQLDRIKSIHSKERLKKLLDAYVAKLTNFVKDEKRLSVIKENMNKTLDNLFISRYSDKLSFYETEGNAVDMQGMIIVYEQDDVHGSEVVGHGCKMYVFKDGVYKVDV